MSEEPAKGNSAPLVRDLATLLALSDRDLLNWREEVREALSRFPDPVLAALYRTTSDEICVRAEKAWAAAMPAGPEEMRPGPGE